MKAIIAMIWVAGVLLSYGMLFVWPQLKEVFR